MADIKEIVLRSQVSRVNNPATSKPVEQENGVSFDSLLQDAELKLSKHAAKRLDLRQIELSAGTREKLKGAVDTLEKKGAKDSLVLMGELAFIVNVPSKTVVTAISKEQMNDHVFTNIDSTILIPPENS